MRRFLTLLSVLACLLAPLRAEQVIFSEIMYHPPGVKPEYVEVWNITNTPLDFAKWQFTDGVSFTFPDFNAGNAQDAFLRPMERIVVSSADPTTTRAAYGISPAVRVYGPWTGSLDNAGERVTLSDKNGVGVCSVKYSNGGRWPKAADGAGHSLVLRNENNPIDSFHNWRQSLAINGTPGGAEFTITEAFPNPEVASGALATILDYGATWKYLTPASDPGTTWRNLGFDESLWLSGPGLLGFENAALPAPGLQTTFGAPGPITYLFRKTFNFSGNTNGASVIIDQIIDDGVAYYLNGTPLGSVGYTPGGQWNVGASRTVGDATEELNVINVPASALVNGANVLSAEVHQVSSGSSDMVFGARLKVSAPASVVINEVKPGAVGQGFVEFFNTTASPIDLNGYYLSDDSAIPTKFRIASSLVVAANSFATIGFAESSLAVAATTKVYLTAPNGVTTVNAISAAMPIDGRALGRDPSGSSSWFLFTTPTLGAPNMSVTSESLSLRLSEVHFDASGNIDWIEIENRSTALQSVSGLSVATADDLSNKIALNGSVPGSGFASFDVSFLVGGSGKVNVYLVDAQGNAAGAAELQRVSGRPSIQAVYPKIPAVLPSYETPKRAAEWFSSPTDTRDAANNPPVTTSIVINEIMCDPPSGQDNGEFFELYNRGGALVNLTGWKVRGGIDLDFPDGTTIPVGGYLVVAGDKAFLQANYPGATVVGNWSGSLGNNGDLIRITDEYGNLADEVDYKVGGDWPVLAGGLGSSLELIHPDMDNSRASAWRDSDESNKTSFTTFTTSGIFQQLTTLGAVTDYKELHLFLVGDAHCIVRNVTLKANGNGANIITNGTVHATDGSSATGWLMQGTHWASYIDNGDIHLIADGHGDNRPNRAEIDATALVQGTNYTLQFEARWVSGKPRLIAQTWDHSIGKPFLLPVPNNLGTAGAANSAATATPPPQVDSILHNPPVPKPANAVTVTARVFSATPLTSVQVFHRASDAAVTGPNGFVAAPMFDNGTNGDAVAGDGLYTATITSHQVNGRIVQFYVRATATGGGIGELPKEPTTYPAMWVVDNRTLDARLRQQRFVIGLYERDSMDTNSGQSTKFQYDFPRLSNHYQRCTFIHNETDVYYNAEIRKSGSPWTRADGNGLDRGKWKVPPDRAFRGRDKSTFDNDAENGARHHNRLVRYWLYVLGHPANENEYVYNVINTDGLFIREDTEPVDGELVSRAFPNGSQGQLMRSDDEWWFQDDWNRSNRNADWSYKNTDESIRYHTEWITRSRETEQDYSSLIEFFKTVSNGSSTEEQLNRVLDPKLTLMMAAVRGYAYDWDSLTISRGKNGFFYRKPTDGRWMFLHWDSDLAFQDANNVVVGGLAGWGTYIGKPWARRTFNYYLTEMLKLTTGTNAARTQAFFDAEEASSTAYTVATSFYQTFFSARQSVIETEINKTIGTGGTGNAFTTTFTAPAGGTTSSATATITGTAPSSAFTIVVVGHPEITVTWLNQTTWRIDGLVLASGLNTFTLQMIDAAGNVIGTTTYSVTKTGNALPVMTLAIGAAAQNVALGVPVTLDAAGSFDPDGGALGFGWSNTPTSGVAVSHPVPSGTTAVFSTPGVYNFTVTGTDPAAGVSQFTREITAYNLADFSPFNATPLEGYWSAQNVAPRNSYSSSAWYSLEDTPKSLVVQVLDDTAKPLAYSNPTHPLLLRPLPASADFALQTDLTLEARRTGTFHTGLYAQLVESGTTVRYAFGIDGGNLLTVKRSTGGTFTTLATPASTGYQAILRIRRVGNSLRFDRRDDTGAWVNIHTLAIAAGSTAQQGGIFLATTTAQSVRVAFDYVLLANPSNITALLGNLRITEVMYHPEAPGTVEFIELRNTGAQAINLSGAHFDAGNPFDPYAFGNVTLSPGAFAIVTNSASAFQTRYGFAATAQWPGGSLNNIGERITLRDVNESIIHDFSYGVTAPWPATPHGFGPSLEVIDTNGNYADGSNWRPSWEIGGSPGFIGAGSDTDGDGQPDSWEILFGTNPNDPGSRFKATSSANAGGQPQVTFPTVSGKSYRIDYSDGLNPPSWQVLTTVSGTGAPVTYTDSTTPKPGERFYTVTPLP